MTNFRGWAGEGGPYPSTTTHLADADNADHGLLDFGVGRLHLKGRRHDDAAVHLLGGQLDGRRVDGHAVQAGLLPAGRVKEAWERDGRGERVREGQEGERRGARPRPTPCSLLSVPRHEAVAPAAAPVVVRGRPVEAGQHGLGQQLGAAHGPAGQGAGGLGELDGQRAVAARDDQGRRAVLDGQRNGARRAGGCARPVKTFQGERQLLFGDGEALGRRGKAWVAVDGEE